MVLPGWLKFHCLAKIFDKRLSFINIRSKTLFWRREPPEWCIEVYGRVAFFTLAWEKSRATKHLAHRVTKNSITNWRELSCLVTTLLLSPYVQGVLIAKQRLGVKLSNGFVLCVPCSVFSLLCRSLCPTFTWCLLVEAIHALVKSWDAVIGDQIPCRAVRPKKPLISTVTCWNMCDTTASQSIARCPTIMCKVWCLSCFK